MSASQKNTSGRRDPSPEALPSLADAIKHPGDYVRKLRRRVRMRMNESNQRTSTYIMLGGVALIMILFIYWMMILFSVPTVGELQEARYAEATIAYTTDGEVLTRYQTKNHVRVTIDEIAPETIDALIATEDHRFYEHGGIDLQRLFGSMLRTAAGDRQGGSTITMQLARNAFPELQGHFVLRRKIEEWITARNIERMYEKEEILEMYLNAVPFMYEAFGIEAGAQTYFQKSAAELELLEGAMLIGMLKGTVFYNPVRNPERAHERRNVVLRQMVKRGYLEEERFQELKEQETTLNFKRLDRADGPAPFFVERLRQWLDEWAQDNGYNLYTSGLQVHTTIDSRLQNAAHEAVQQIGDQLQAVVDVEWSRPSLPFITSNVGSYERYRANIEPFAYFWQGHPDVLNAHVRRTHRYRSLLNSGVEADSALTVLAENTAFIDSVKTEAQRLEAGFVAMDPRTGHVKAWVGGRDFRRGQYDHVSQAKRQPGSTFKPFVYAAAIEDGFAPEDRMRDVVMDFDDGTGRTWSPQNVGGSTGRLMTLDDGLAQSKNTITAQLTAEIGPRRVIDMAHKMGIDSELDEVLSLGLGTSNVTLLEMTTAYSTLASNGRYRRPMLLTRIEDRDGNLLAVFNTESREAINPSTAYTVLDMMRGVIDSGTGRRIRTLFGGRGDFAGKTGTTQNSTDGWFMLMHPHLVMGSWVGFDDPALSFRSSYWGQGAHNALTIVGTTLRQADLPRVDFEAPPGYQRPRPQRTAHLAEVDSLLQDVEGQVEADSLNRMQRGDGGTATPAADTSGAAPPDPPSRGW